MSGKNDLFKERTTKISEEIEKLIPVVKNGLDNLQTNTDFIDLINLYNSIIKLNQLEKQLSIIKNHGIYMINITYSNIQCLPSCAQLVQERIKKLSPPLYEQPLILRKYEVVNGYSLYECNKPILYYYDFQELVKLMKEDTRMSLEEFMTHYNENICSDWGKFDEHGNCFEGFWNFPKESYEYQNASELTKNKNGKLLWELPFPTKFLLKTIEIGCGNRQECVRYSNFLGVWVERKMIQINSN